MSLIKKIAPRIGLILLIIIISNYVYKSTTYPSDLADVDLILEKFNAVQGKADVLYFSSSPNATFSSFEDADQRSISKIVDDAIPDLNIMSVDTGAIHAGVFKALIKMIPKNSQVKKIIVNLNYRSLGVGWIESELENAIQKSMLFYNNYPAIINRYMQGLNAYEAKSNKERERIKLNEWATAQLPFEHPQNTVENWCALEKWGDWTNPKRQLADHYIKNFAFTLEENNPRLQDYDEIVELCKAKEIELIYVVLPENLEEAEELVGPDLTALMIDNKNELVDRYTSMGVTVIDDFEILSDSLFIERHFPSEHYFEKGRKMIAESIIDYFKGSTN